MPHSKVTKVQLGQDGRTLCISVYVDGFDPGTPLEISGNAVQAHGANASFHEVKRMPDNGSNGAELPVTAVSDSDLEFVEDKPIVTVAKAAECWVTRLNQDSGDKSFGIKAVWKEDTSGYSDPSGGEAPAPQASAPQETSSPQVLWSVRALQPAQPRRHGTWWDWVKSQPPEEVAENRFIKLFPSLPAAGFNPADLKVLAQEMTSQPEGETTRGTEPDPEENRGIPAAYTYLGQFTDHDLTFAPTSPLRGPLTTQQLNTLVNLRTPRFDLDNLYGRGPDEQPYMYEPDGIRMALGEPMSGNPLDPGARQLPRGPNGRALIGDPRNDENRIVAQLHAIFLRFHNQVTDHLGRNDASFQDVRQQVQWHYQWVLVNDFLPIILEEQTYRSVFPDPHRAVLTIPRLQTGLELMPVEFSVAAYRFGHSMIRPEYRLNTTIRRRPIFSTSTDPAADLGGFRRIPADWAIDWQLFIDIEHSAGPAAGDPLPEPVVREPQLSYKIDTALASPLGNLPPQIATDPSSLALRNLERGLAFGLPSGQEVATALHLQPMADEELVIGRATADSSKKPITQVAHGFAGNAPLWTYILSEAQVTSWKHADPNLAKDDIPIKLGPVGGRLIAEVFASLLLGDPTSYLHAETAFAPIPDFTHEGAFGLAELINVALGRAP
jgi:Animal haem peroxidase